MREHRYAPPQFVEIGTVHECTLGSVVAADGQHFSGHIELPFKTSVHCVKRHGQLAQAAVDRSGHIGFTLPEVV